MAVCAVVVFALDDARSFAALTSWIDMLRTNTDHEVPVVIVGNKLDVENRVIDMGNAKTWAQQKNYPIFFTSAATGENVKSLFEFITANFIALRIQQSSTSLETDDFVGTTGCC
jgi:GTPase SAR1 family protein